MPPRPPTPRRKVIEVPPEWHTCQLDPKTGTFRRVRRAKSLTATVGERVVERQLRRLDGRDETTE